jgi:hypothetical protein
MGYGRLTSQIEDIRGFAMRGRRQKELFGHKVILVKIKAG